MILQEFQILMQEWIQQLFDKQHHFYNHHFNKCKPSFFEHLNFSQALLYLKHGYAKLAHGYCYV